MDAANLKRKLTQIDGRGYKAYREIGGSHGIALPGQRAIPEFTLYIDHVQGDPFAAPSRMRVRVSRQLAGFEPQLFETPVRQVALEDFLARAFRQAIKRFVKGGRGTGKSGFIGVDAGGQEILHRTAAVINQEFVEVRFTAGLPASGRRCLGLEAAAMLLQEVPALVEASLSMRALDSEAIRAHIESAEDQEYLRNQLREMGIVAFVADGSQLPRHSGIDDGPLMTGHVVDFQAPQELRVTVSLPNGGQVDGMGIPEGVTLIVGGGYHGKSTLLSAIERGVYSHIPGDGRELAATREDAVKIRAEDGRRVERVDISPFVANLPFGTDTVAFRTENASGSTSQAANIVEALEAGARLLLIDEDTSATNFMIRDELMQRLISKEKEPITPFIDQVRNLYREYGVSTILVMGGSGDYFEVADTVIAMESYKPRLVTAEARRIAADRQDVRAREGGDSFGALRERLPLAQGINPVRGGRSKVQVKALGSLMFGRQTVDLTSVEQLVDISQTRAIGDLVLYGRTHGFFDGQTTLAQVLDRMFGLIRDKGLDVISPLAGRNGVGGHPGDYAMPRRYEVAAMLNRLRSLEVEQA